MVREKAMREALLVAIVTVAVATGSLPAIGADRTGQESVDIDSVIRRLEESGALDAAIDRGVQRYIQREIQARQKQQEAQQQRQAEAAKNARPVDVSRDHILGNTQAEVSVIVYTDLECPFCKQFAGTPEQAISKFNGNANFVFRHFPLAVHGENAARGAYYAQCVGHQAGSKGFFAFTNDWFRLTGANGKGLERGNAQIKEIALSAGAKDLAALDSCANDAGVAQVVEDDMADGARSGISGTPGVIVRNNKTGVSLPVAGAVSARALEALIAQALHN